MSVFATPKNWIQGNVYGEDNPTEVVCEHRQKMIKTMDTAWSHRHSVSTPPWPIWCFQRFGQSRTPLSDGRIVCIGGEHEDWYDPDFCIYNDVVVKNDRDGSTRIFVYPRDVFPPTDFHSATLFGDDDQIFIIGRLGYLEDRVPGRTPVFRLDCNTYQIHSVQTSGEDPGYIYRHRAYPLAYPDGARIICISGGYHLIPSAPLPTTTSFSSAPLVEQSNQHTYELDLDTWEWTKLPSS